MSLFLQDDQGFSLVETLVATVIFALISASGVVILSGYQESRLGLDAADARLAELETGRALIRSDLLMTVDRPVRDALGGVKKGFEGGAFLEDGAIVRFVRTGDMGALLHGNRTALKRVEYILESGNLIRRTYAQTDITFDTASKDAVLLSDLKEISVRFEAEGIWVEEWGSGSDVAPPPGLAEFKIVFNNGRSLDLTFLIGGAA